MPLIEDIAQALGSLHGWGVADAAPFPAVRTEMVSRIADGSHGGLRFTYADPAVATDVTRSFPWARRLIVGAHGYASDAGSPGTTEPSTGRVARFATDDHYEPLRTALTDVAHLLRDRGHRAEVLVDDNRLVDRAVAVRAGVGWWGRNTMVLAPGIGPWMLLGSVATDADVEVSAPMRRDCGTCTACIPACPTGALDGERLDARRCLATWLQSPGRIPTEFRAPMGDRIYGCDDCLEACPPGGRAVGRRSRGRVDLLELLAASDAALLARFDHFYLPRRSPRFLRRNALVALANGGGPDAAGVLAGYLGHPDWLLRAHAAWGLGALGGAAAGAALAARRRRERHDDVREEIEQALATGTFA